MVTITAKEWRRAIGFALFVILLTSIPYIIAWGKQDDQWVFSGALFGVEDGNSYLAKMRLGARGSWDFHLFYTPETTEGAPLMFLPYIAVGQLVGRVVPAEQIAEALKVAFQVMRVVFDFLLIVVLYRFIAQFITSEKGRYFALVLASLGGGLGWITLFIGLQPNPPEMYIPEGFGFLVLFSLPHIALARAMLLIGFLLVIPPQDTQERPYSRRVIMAGLAWCVVGLCVPFYFAVTYVLLGVWGLAAWAIQRRFPTRLFLRAVVAGALTLPLFLYYAWVFANNWAFAHWSSQNILTSPPPLDYLLSYGLLIMLALIALRGVVRQAYQRVEYALLIGWLIAAPILVYLPINVQRRLGEGVIIPLAICAALGLRQLFRAQDDAIPPRSIREIARSGGQWVMLGILCLSTVLILATATIAATTQKHPVFISGAQIRAFEWLNQTAEAGEIVFAAWGTGNTLPVYSDLRPFVGLGPETLNAEPKNEQVIEPFFSVGMTESEFNAAITATCADETCQPHYIFYGNNEHALNPSQAEIITNLSTLGALIYDAEGIQIYRIHE